MKSTANTSRYIPSTMDTNLDYNECCNCEVFFTNTNENSGKAYYAIGFVGKGKNHSFHYHFSSKERMMNYIEQFVEKCKKNLAYKNERKAKQKAANANVTVEVGDLFCSSGGYDQTNVSYYQVIEVKAKTAKLMEIGSINVKGSEGFMCCNVIPVKNSFLNDKVYTKRIQASYDGRAYFAEMYWGNAYPASEGTSHYCSWYA